VVPVWRWRNGMNDGRALFRFHGKSISGVRSHSKRTGGYLQERRTETLGLLYCRSFPIGQMANVAGIRRSPCTSILKRLARLLSFGEAPAWERANWFANEARTASEMNILGDRPNTGFQNSAAEHMAYCAKRPWGYSTWTSFGKIRVEGANAH